MNFVYYVKHLNFCAKNSPNCLNLAPKFKHLPFVYKVNLVLTYEIRPFWIFFKQCDIESILWCFRSTYFSSVLATCSVQVSNLRASRAANNSICACKFFTSSRQQTIGKLEGGIWRYLHLLLLFLDHYYQSMLATFLVITGRAHRTNCGPRTTWKTVVKVAQKTHFTLGFVGCSGCVRYDYCCSLFCV